MNIESKGLRREPDEVIVAHRHSERHLADSSELRDEARAVWRMGWSSAAGTLATRVSLRDQWRGARI